jgi:hypothetical protein
MEDDWRNVDFWVGLQPYYVVSSLKHRIYPSGSST